MEKSFVEDHTFENVKEGILEHLRINGKAFQEREIQLKDYNALLIVIESNEKESEWSGFFPPQYVEDISLEYKMPSLVLLINSA